MSGHERSLFYSLPNSKLTLIREGRAVPLRGAVGTDDTVLSWERLCLATLCLYYGGRATRRPTTSNGPQRTPTRASIAPASSSDTAPARFSHETGCDLGRFPIRACSCVPLLVIVCGLSSKRHAQSQFERGGQGAELGFCCLHGCQFCDCVRFEKTNRTQSQNRHSRHARELGFCDCGGTGSGDCARRAAGANLQRPRRGGQVGLCRGFRRRAWSVGLDGISWRANTKARRV